VVGRFAAATDVHHWKRDSRGVALRRATSPRHDGIVLHEEEAIGDLTADPRREALLLQSVDLHVRAPPEVDDLERRASVLLNGRGSGRARHFFGF
jgi:hypothetical protein